MNGFRTTSSTVYLVCQQPQDESSRPQTNAFDELCTSSRQYEQINEQIDGQTNDCSGCEDCDERPGENHPQNFYQSDNGCGYDDYFDRDFFQQQCSEVERDESSSYQNQRPHHQGTQEQTDHQVHQGADQLKDPPALYQVVNCQIKMKIGPRKVVAQMPTLASTLHKFCSKVIKSLKHP